MCSQIKAAWTCRSRSTSMPHKGTNRHNKQCQRSRCVAMAKQEDDLDAMMAEDLQQFSAQATKSPQVVGVSSAEESGNGIKEIVDKVWALGKLLQGWRSPHSHREAPGHTSAMACTHTTTASLSQSRPTRVEKLGCSLRVGCA